jgi:hypothetical protein
LLWVIIVGFLGLFAVGVPRTFWDGRSQQQPAEGKGEKREGEEQGTTPSVAEAERGGPLSVFQEFLGTAPEEPATSASRGPFGLWPFCGRDSVSGRRPALSCQELRQYRPESLIVTIPDPIDSPFGFNFDQMIEAIERALKRSGNYVLDRAWLPWEADRQVVAKNGRIVGKLRKTLPGVLLFRYVGEPDKLCAVFLVGENPTSGIHKRAFTKALDLIKDYGLKGGKHAGRFRIVGPYFSGSEFSLQMAVKKWSRHATASFCRINGSATGVRPKHGRDDLAFKTTVIPTAKLRDAVLHYLAKRSDTRHDDAPDGNGLGKVAYLYEHNTGFGMAFYQRDRGKSLLLSFPLHISRLKASVEHLRRQKEESLGLPPRSSLVPSYREEPWAQQEAIRSQDPVTTASINGIALSNILSAIVREKVRYVGIAATDVRDKVFLAHSIRENCPAVQIFILGSDLLLTHPERSPFLKGAVIGSTYPLFLENQRWTRPSATKGRRALATDSAPLSDERASGACHRQRPGLLQRHPGLDG